MGLGPALATLVLGCAALVPVAIAHASLAGATSSPVQDIAGTTQLNDVACPSATTCVAVGTGQVNGTTEAVVVPIANGTPGTVQGVSGVPALSGVACATETQCYAVGGSAVVPISNGTAGTPVSTSASLTDVACASSTSCVAVGKQNDPAGVPISDGVVGSPVDYSLSGVGELSAVTCPDSSGCTAYGENTSVLCLPHQQCITVNDIESVALGPDASFVSASVDGGFIFSTGAVSDASCPTTSICYETGSVGGNSFVTNLPTSGRENVIPNGAGASGIACVSASACVGVGAARVSSGIEGVVIGISNGQPSAPALIPGVTGTTIFAGLLNNVSCPTATNCFAVGDTQVNGSTQGVILSLTPPTTNVLIPQDGSSLAGKVTLDAAASDNVAVTQVNFAVTGGTLNGQVIATATPTLFGWLAQWNTTTVPNGTYTLESVATDTEGFSTTSAPIMINVSNPPPMTVVLIPSNGAIETGGAAPLDATASSNVSTVSFELTGGALNDQHISGGFPTLYGWLGQWNTTTVPNGTYTLQSVASYPNGVSTTSAGTIITVNNPAPTTAVIIPSNGATQSGGSALLDATASSNVSTVSFELTGGALNDQVISDGFPTLYGWLGQWNTTTVPNGTYTLQSAASYPNGVSTTSAGVTITIAN